MVDKQVSRIHSRVLFAGGGWLYLAFNVVLLLTAWRLKAVGDVALIAKLRALIAREYCSIVKL